MTRNKNKKNKKSKYDNNDPLVLLPAQGISPPKSLRYSRAIEMIVRLQQAGSVVDAERLCLVLMEHAPTKHEAALQLLSCYAGRLALAEADMLIMRMKVLYGAEPSVYIAIGDHYRVLGKVTEAFDLLTSKSQLLNDYPNFHILLGGLYITLNKKEDAISSYLKAINLDETSVEAYVGLVRILKDKMSADHIAYMEGSLSKASLPVKRKAQLLFALAWYYEKTDKEKYFVYLNKANASFARDPSRKIKSQIDRLEAIKNNFTEDFAGIISSRESVNSSPIFIVAMPRSGTTLLEQIIGSHSMAFPVGETSVMGAVEMEVGPRYRDKIAKWCWDEGSLNKYAKDLCSSYLKSPMIAKTDKRIVDKSVDNHGLVGLIFMAWPGASVIRLKRHPLDIVLSCYHNQFHPSVADYLFDLKAIAEYLVIHKRIMDFWEERFPERILSVDYEQLVSEGEAEIKKIINFCKLPWEDACLDFYRNKHAVRTSSDLQVRQALYSSSIEKWRDYESFLTPAIKVFQREGLM